MKTDTYTMLDGQVVTYSATPAAAAFLKRVQEAASDPRLDDGALTNLIYGTENPILRQDILPGHGVVTAESLKDPLYLVMVDILGRKLAAVLAPLTGP